MKIFSYFFLFAAVSFACLRGNSQATTKEVKAARQMVDTAQKTFRSFIRQAAVTEPVKIDLKRFAINSVNSLENNLQFFVTAPLQKRIKAIRSLGFFMKELQRQIQLKKISEHDIPGAIQLYKQTLADVLSEDAVSAIKRHFAEKDWRKCELMADAFWEFEEKKQMAAISTYKRVLETPEYIFPFLETQPAFPYTDTLLNFIAKTHPEQLEAYLQKNNNAVTDSIRSQKNVYIQQLVSFASNSLASELAPFAEQIVNNELAIDDILEKRQKVDDYFQLLVNTMLTDKEKDAVGDDPEFETAVTNALAQKSLDFYVKKINELHNAPEAERFHPVQSLRPQDLYYIIVSSDEEMYTSTYLGLYKRLLAFFKGQSADSLFNLVHRDQFRKFMRIAATYNTLNDFLGRMPTDSSRDLIHLFISDIESNNEDEAISNASDISDAFIALARDSLLNEWVREELQLNLEKNKAEGKYKSVRLYSVLQQVYNIVNNDDPDDFSSNYKRLSISSLKNKGILSELVLFYGDEDGKNSYSSFMRLFKDKTKWEIVTNDSWSTITSLQGQPIKIYANLPLNDDEEQDLAAQEALRQYMEQQSIQPSILIHRGHSYHLANTLKYLTPSIKLAILGSCGGYKNMNRIIEINPDVHIIASRQVGSMIVNDPLLNLLNNDLSQGRNIDWVLFWDELGQIFKTDPAASKLFEEYIPPYKNVSSYVIRLYKYDSQDPEAGK